MKRAFAKKSLKWNSASGMVFNFLKKTSFSAIQHYVSEVLKLFRALTLQLDF